MLTHYDMGSQFSGIVFTGGPPYSDLKWACGKECDVVNDPDFPNTQLGCFAAVSRWGVDQGYGQADVPDIRDPEDEGGCGDDQGSLPGIEECGEREFPGLCMSHAHEDPLNPNRLADEALLEANSIAVDLNRWIYDYHDDLGLRFLYGDGDGGPAVDQQDRFYQAVAHNIGVEAPAEVLDTGHRVPAKPNGRTEILAALLETCVIVQP